MKIYFITFAFPPLHYPRSVQVSRLIESMDLPIHVICGDEARNRDPSISPTIESKLASILRIRRPRWRYFIDGLLYKFCPTLLQLPDIYLDWAMLAQRKILKTIKFTKDDIIFTFGCPMSVHFLGLAIKKKYSVKWIAHFSDPWADHPFIKLPQWAKILNLRMEKKIIENADHLIFTSKETVELVMQKYSKELLNKTRVIGHAYDPELDTLQSERAMNSPICLRYLGNFYGDRSPEPLLAALSHLYAKNPDLLKGVKIEFIGQIERKILETFSQYALPESYVKHIPSVNYKESLILMEKADLLLLIDAPADISVFLPSKLVDYLGAKKPILGITPKGTSARVIQAYGGWVADPSDLLAIEETLMHVLEEIRKRIKKDAELAWGNPEVRSHYHHRFIGSEVMKLISEQR